MLPSKVLKYVMPLPGLKAAEKLVLCNYAYRANDEDSHAWPYSKTIAADTGLAIRVVERARASLVKKGYLLQVRRTPQFVVYEVRIPELLAAHRTAEVAERSSDVSAVALRQSGGGRPPNPAVAIRLSGGRREKGTTEGPSEEPREPPPSPQGGEISLRDSVLKGIDRPVRPRELRRLEAERTRSAQIAADTQALSDRLRSQLAERTEEEIVDGDIGLGLISAVLTGALTHADLDAEAKRGGLPGLEKNPEKEVC